MTNKEHAAASDPCPLGDSCPDAHKYGDTHRDPAVPYPGIPADLRRQIREERLEMERDAARFIHLQNIPAKAAQAFFWNYSSRKQRAKAIDQAILAREGGKS